jgi:hypothetical protein
VKGQGIDPRFTTFFAKFEDGKKADSVNYSKKFHKILEQSMLKLPMNKLKSGKYAAAEMLVELKKLTSTF